MRIMLYCGITRTCWERFVSAVSFLFCFYTMATDVTVILTSLWKMTFVVANLYRINSQKILYFADRWKILLIRSK
jgi:hypothetical protein